LEKTKQTKSQLYQLYRSYRKWIPKHYWSINVLNELIALLNDRENYIDLEVDQLKNRTSKFSVFDIKFIDSLLENFYNSLSLSLAARNFRKRRLTLKEIIVAILHAFRVQKTYLIL